MVSIDLLGFSDAVRRAFAGQGDVSQYRALREASRRCSRWAATGSRSSHRMSCSVAGVDEVFSVTLPAVLSPAGVLLRAGPPG